MRIAIGPAWLEFRRGAKPLKDDTTCPVCGQPAATQGNGTLLYHQRAAEGGGYMPCEDSAPERRQP